MLDLLGTNEQGTVVGRSIFPGQKSVTGGAAGGRLYVMSVKRSSILRQPVNVGRLYVACAEALQFRAQVINANQQHVRPV